MKEKSFMRPGAGFLKVHMLIFGLFELGIAANILITINHPANQNVSFDNFKMMILQSLTVSLVWAVSLIIHFGVHEFRSQYREWTQRRSLNIEDTSHRHQSRRLLDHSEMADDPSIASNELWQHVESDNFQQSRR